MIYLVHFTPHAEKDFLRLDEKVSWRVLEKIEWLRRNMDCITPVPLKGVLKDMFKLRVGG